MFLALLYRAKYDTKKMLILTSHDMLKEQLIEEISALTDDDKIWFEVKSDFRKHEFSAVLIDEVDVWGSENACVFLRNGELGGMKLLNNIARVHMFTATITDVLK